MRRVMRGVSARWCARPSCGTGFRGLKLHGHEAMPTREVCEAAQEFRLPVIVDVAGKAHVIDMFASEYPQVNFIIAHLGSFADDWRAHERVVEQVARYPNVLADTSGVRRFDYLVDAIEAFGSTEGPVRIGWAVAASRCRAAQDSPARAVAHRRGTRPRR